MKYILLLSVLAQIASADVGQVIRTAKGYILRGTTQLPLKSGTALEQNDRIIAHTPSLIYIEPSTQVALSKGSEITLTQNFLDDPKEKRSFSLIELFKGFIRIRVTRDVGVEIDQQVKAKEVTFAVRGTEFEVALSGDDVSLEVVDGQVEASSTLVQSFAPEIIKKNEGLSFTQKGAKFARRKVALKMNRPEFLKKKDIQAKWKKRQKVKKS